MVGNQKTGRWFHLSYWKMGKGRYGYCTPRGKRGIVSSLTQVPASCKGGSSKTASKTAGKTTRRRTTTSNRKKTARRAARKTFGNMSIKGVLIGGALLAGVKTVVRRVAPQLGAYTPGASALGAGIAADVIGVSGKSLKTFGLIDVASEGMIDLVNPGGLVTLPGVPAAASTGRYQY